MASIRKMKDNILEKQKKINLYIISVLLAEQPIN